MTNVSMTNVSMTNVSMTNVSMTNVNASPTTVTDFSTDFQLAVSKFFFIEFIGFIG